MVAVMTALAEVDSRRIAATSPGTASVEPETFGVDWLGAASLDGPSPDAGSLESSTPVPAPLDMTSPLSVPAARELFDPARSSRRNSLNNSVLLAGRRARSHSW